MSIYLTLLIPVNFLIGFWLAGRLELGPRNLSQCLEALQTLTRLTLRAGGEDGKSPSNAA